MNTTGIVIPTLVKEWDRRQTVHLARNVAQQMVQSHMLLSAVQDRSYPNF